MKFVFPAGALLPPRGYTVVWSDNQTNLPGLHTGFSLRGEGESVWLFGSNSNGLVQLDQLSFGLQLSDRTVGRVPDGTGAWQLTQATPNGSNEVEAVGSEQSVRINEWMANPVSGSDWFELFNAQSLPVALGGLYLSDDLLEPTNSPIPALSFLEGWGFRQTFADNELEKGADHVVFNLRASGEAIGLYEAGGNGIRRGGVWSAVDWAFAGTNTRRPRGDCFTGERSDAWELEYRR